MPALKREDQIDQQYQDKLSSHPDLADLESRAGEGELDYAKGGADDAESYANKNRDNVKQGEETAPSEKNGFFRDDRKDKKPKGFFRFDKKKGPMAAILGIFGLGGGVFFFSFPALVGIHFTETLADDLNDQLSATEIRTTHVLRAKITKMGAIGSICSDTINIRCKFGAIGPIQSKNFKAAGFKFMCGDSECSGRFINTPSKIITPSGREVSSPREFVGLMSTDTKLKSDLRRAFNPTYRMLSDAKAVKAFKKWGGKANRFLDVKDKTQAAFQEKLLSSTETRASQLGTLRIQDKQVVDESGQPAVDSVTNQPIEMSQSDIDQHNATVDRLKGSGGVGKLAGRITRTVGVLGGIDAACTVKNLIRGVSTGAKVIRSEQMGRFAAAVHAVNHGAKAGDPSITPETVNFINTEITQTDTRKEIVDPDSDDSLVMMENPSYGKSSLDSTGFKLAAYGDVPSQLPYESAQYSLASAGVNFNLSAVPTTGCKIVQSTVVRGASLIGGMVLGFVTGGTSTILQSAAISVGAGFLISYLEQQLSAMLAGNVINEDTKATQFGDAAFAGTAVIMSGIAKNRGLRPLTSSTVNAYMNTTGDVKSEVALQETELAKSEPFNTANQYSFLGSISRNLMPTYTTSSSTASFLASLPMTSFSSITKTLQPKLYAKSDSPERFQKCKDDDYEKLEIAADVFCNVRYGLSEKELALDSESVMEYMLSNGYIEDSGAPKGDYQEYLTDCTESTEAVYADEGGNVDKYRKCTTDGPGDKYNYFRVFTVDNSIVEAMEYDGEETSDGPTANAGVGERPANTEDKGKGWSLKANTDYSAVACSAGTTDAGTYTHPEAKFTFRKCKIQNATTNSLVSASIVAMIEAAKAEGVNLTIGNSFRSYEEQQAVYNKNCRSGRCTPPTAKPGNSQHERGLSIDFSQCGSRSTACYKWLNTNAVKYGFYNLPSESWHWSTSGN